MSGYSIVTVERQHTAVVKATVTFADLQTAERAARTKLAHALPTLRTEQVGNSFTLCRMPKDGKMSIEPGVIVTRAFDSDGDVVCSQLPAGRAVKHVLVGSFDQLPQAWPALFSWCASEGLKREGAFWQIYGPTAADPAKQETILYALLA
jgi:effector-binding domain-containing protein